MDVLFFPFNFYIQFSLKLSSSGQSFFFVRRRGVFWSLVSIYFARVQIQLSMNFVVCLFCPNRFFLYFKIIQYTEIQKKKKS